MAKLTKKEPVVVGYRDGCPIVVVEHLGGVQVSLVCPYCRETHLHGTGGGPGPEYGWRSSHCEKRAPGSEYFLVAG